mmetsp:Transcript_19848/g.22088  ORF Transcript_19848/g.22088 Transcript_19848/m.22088 type:complete len:251 (+) Transcript_19848:279-1031(+)
MQEDSKNGLVFDLDPILKLGPPESIFGLPTVQKLPTSTAEPDCIREGVQTSFTWKNAVNVSPISTTPAKRHVRLKGMYRNEVLLSLDDEYKEYREYVEYYDEKTMIISFSDADKAEKIALLWASNLLNIETTPPTRKLRVFHTKDDVKAYEVGEYLRPYGCNREPIIIHHKVYGKGFLVTFNTEREATDAFYLLNDKCHAFNNKSYACPLYGYQNNRKRYRTYIQRPRNNNRNKRQHVQRRRNGFKRYNQ